MILHVRYTARDGGAPLRAAAVQQVKDLIDTAQVSGAMRLFSMRHEFPGEWARLTQGTPAVNQRRELAFRLRPEHYPFWSQGRLNTVVRVDLLARAATGPAPATLTVADRVDATDAGTLKDTLTRNAALDDLLVGRLTNVPAPAAPTGEVKLYFDNADLEDLWIAVTWRG